MWQEAASGQHHRTLWELFRNSAGALRAAHGQLMGSSRASHGQLTGRVIGHLMAISWKLTPGISGESGASLRQSKNTGCLWRVCGSSRVSLGEVCGKSRVSLGRVCGRSRESLGRVYGSQRTREFLGESAARLGRVWGEYAAILGAVGGKSRASLREVCRGGCVGVWAVAI